MKEKIEKLIKVSATKSLNYKFNEDIPNRPNSLSMYKWLSKEIAEINEEIDRLEVDNQLKSKCEKGCSACCRQCIVVFMSEAVPMETYINNLSIDEKNKLKENVKNVCTQLEQHGITKNTVNSCNTQMTQQKLQTQYFEMKIPCVFLDDEGTCKIHNIRPTACWKYREYESSEKCSKSWNSDTSIDFVDWESVEFKRIITARPKGARLTILPFAIKELMNW